LKWLKKILPVHSPLKYERQTFANEQKLEEFSLSGVGPEGRSEMQEQRRNSDSGDKLGGN
jgi:hypothetical protein